MVYPPAPWNLQGHALLTCHLIDVGLARTVIPPEFEIVSLLPGKTLGGVYLSSYDAGSILPYNELIVTAALVRYGQAIGSWISHIYVDHPDSVAGGREIWGLPKELADFTWSPDRVTVYQADRLLCSLHNLQPWFRLPSSWQPRLKGTVFSQLGPDLLRFESRFQSAIAVGKGHLTVPETSPLARLNLGQAVFRIDMANLFLQAGVPQVMGQSQSSDGSTCPAIAQPDL